MDANRTPFVLLDRASDFIEAGAAVEWEDGTGLLLGQVQQPRLEALGEAAGSAAIDVSTPLLLDNFGQYALPDAAHIRIWSGRDTRLLQDGEDRTVTANRGDFVDLDVNDEGILAAVSSNGSNAHGLTRYALGSRETVQLTLPHRPLRVAVERGTRSPRLWCLSADHLTLVEGTPLPQPYHPQSDRFEPCTVNPHAPRVREPEPLPNGGWRGLALAVGQRWLAALAVNNPGDQALIVWPLDRPGGQAAVVLPLVIDNGNGERCFVTDLAWLSESRLALLCGWSAQAPDAAAVELIPTADGLTLGRINRRYPMRELGTARFARSADGKVRYQSRLIGARPPDAPAAPAFRPRRLAPLARPAYPTVVQHLLPGPVDGLQQGVVWHRVVIKARIPAGGGVTIHARASDSHAEATGFTFDQLLEQPPLYASTPDGEGFAEYDTLLQTRDFTVNRLQGRHLRLGIEFRSDRHCTPVLRRLSAYFPRFSYQEAYLPPHMRQHQVAVRGAANGADVRERVLASLEGMLSTIESGIADAERFVNPQTTDPQNLAWLANMLGSTVPDAWPVPRKRALLDRNGELQQRRGTRAGLAMALDLLSDGEVSRGALVAVENFRLRRTIATALGLDFDDRDHPLTLGTGLSANSIVGAGLTLGEDDARDYLAGAAPDLLSASDRERAREFFDRYSHRVTVLRHESCTLGEADLTAALPDLLPAHVQWQTASTSRAYVLGLAPLLGIHTFVEDRPGFSPATLGTSNLGANAVVANAPALSPEDVHAEQVRRRD